jgi:hypothetical protein
LKGWLLTGAIDIEVSPLYRGKPYIVAGVVESETAAFIRMQQRRGNDNSPELFL